jgi:hypothetical protein
VLMVDIAIRALSPAINDPTTAVQALDRIGEFLIHLVVADLRYARRQAPRGGAVSSSGCRPGTTFSSCHSARCGTSAGHRCRSCEGCGRCSRGFWNPHPASSVGREPAPTPRQIRRAELPLPHRPADRLRCRRARARGEVGTDLGR